jgi:hypothetical protein
MMFSLTTKRLGDDYFINLKINQFILLKMIIGLVSVSEFSYPCMNICSVCVSKKYPNIGCPCKSYALCGMNGGQEIWAPLRYKIFIR